MKIGEFMPKVEAPKTAMEAFIQRGVFNDRDVDYLSHLQIPLVDEVAMEGVVGAVVKDAVNIYHDAYSEMKGWFLGIESKRKYIEEICDSLIDWLKDKDLDNKDLDLDMGTIKTWMKTSETFHWRFYFLLNDSTWHKIESDLKKGEISGLEVLYDLEFKDRVEVTRYLDSQTDIKSLIKIVERYRERSNKFFELILKRKVKVKGAPFQVILLGATDLRLTMKKIVNLAV